MEASASPVLCLLGPPRWSGVAGEPLLRVDRPSQLLCLLACRRGWVARDELAEWLWPERGQAQALGNLRTALLRAERFARGAPLERQANYLRWLSATDVQRFEASLAAACDSHRTLEAPPGVLLQGMKPGSAPPPPSGWTPGGSVSSGGGRRPRDRICKRRRRRHAAS